MKKILDHVASQVSDPVKFRRLNGWLTVFWFVMVPVAAALGLIYILAFTALLSIYANFATHLGAWAASRTEARQVDEVEKAEEINVQNAERVNVNTPCKHCGK